MGEFGKAPSVWAFRAFRRPRPRSHCERSEEQKGRRMPWLEVADSTVRSWSPKLKQWGSAADVSKAYQKGQSAVAE